MKTFKGKNIYVGLDVHKASVEMNKINNYRHSKPELALPNPAV